MHKAQFLLMVPVNVSESFHFYQYLHPYCYLGLCHLKGQPKRGLNIKHI